MHVRNRHLRRVFRLLILLLPFTLVACGDVGSTPTPTDPATELSAAIYRGSVATSLTAAEMPDVLSRPLRPGLVAQLVDDPDGQMVVVTASFGLLRPRILGTTASRPDGVVPEELVLDDATALVIGSGFVSELMALTPLGLLQVEGEVVSRIQRHGYTRVLGVSERGMGIVDHLQYERGLFESALQVGPGVIEQGQLDISVKDLERPPYFRAVVGTCGDTALFAASLTPMHLHGVGRAIQRHTSQMQLECDELVNLAGDREALLGVRLADGPMLVIGNPRTSRAAVITLESVPAG